MKELKKQEGTVVKMLCILVAAGVLIWLMAFFDAFEWFYDHSRKYEAYDYDEFVLLFFLFLIIGMSWLAFSLYRKAICEPRPHTDAAGQDILTAETIFSESRERFKRSLPDSYKSPVFLFISLVMIIGVVEILDMFLIHNLPDLPYHLKTLLDTFFLILMVSPAIYFTFFRPLLKQIIFRELAEEKLKQLNLELENRIDQRTAELHKELETRKQTEAMVIRHQHELRSLATQMSMLEERERKRIARELHDNIGHSLAIVNNRLELLRSALTAEQEQEVRDIKKLVIESIRFSRDLSSELSSPLMEDLPFVSALNWLAEEILDRNDIHFTVTAEDAPELPGGDIRTILMKAIKEILINIVKHSEADRVEIHAGTEDDDVTVEIRDNGRGFKVAEVLKLTPTRKLGIGLFTIQEQLTNLNGSFAISSNPDHGTVVTLSVPGQMDNAL